MDLEGNPLRFAYGPLPLWVQTVPVSELFGLFQILRWMTAGRVHTDCQMVVDGFAKGELHPTNADGPYSKIWKGIFDRARGKDIEVVKVLAHATDADVVAGRIDHECKKANDFVDTCAKLGAAKHKVSRAVSISQKAVFVRVDTVARFLAKVVICTSSARRDRPIRVVRRKRGVAGRVSIPFSLDTVITRCEKYNNALALVAPPKVVETALSAPSEAVLSLGVGGEQSSLPNPESSVV